MAQSTALSVLVLATVTTPSTVFVPETAAEAAMLTTVVRSEAEVVTAVGLASLVVTVVKAVVASTGMRVPVGKAA